ncbi:MAG: PDZ domain-containing protein [Acholeplasmataceae bacterium]|jgi:serine protease Do|nr:PDZ domain-containing protein [Acholeplasmataceae bacterium]
MQGRKLFRNTFSILFGILLGVVLVVGGCSLSRQGPAATNENIQKIAGQASAAEPSEARNTPIVKAAKKVGPAVVGITNKALVRDIFNRVQLTEMGTGSGVIYDKKGLIVTNNHVVEGAQEIVVSLADGRSVPGRVLGGDAATDLAVVKIDAEDLTVASFGDSDQIMVGEPAIAIGNPLGLEFRGSVTAGVISALNRSIDLGERKFKLIQTDAAINPGNSGGALVNADGEVIGINSAKIAVSGVEGIGFAIPINAAKPIVADLEKQGRVLRPYLGVTLIDKEIAQRYGIDIDLQGGIFVLKVIAGGPAWKAGIRANDVIVKFNDETIGSVTDLRDKIASLGIGAAVNVTIKRGSQERNIEVILEEMPARS